MKCLGDLNGRPSDHSSTLGETTVDRSNTVIDVLRGFGSGGRGPGAGRAGGDGRAATEDGGTSAESAEFQEVAEDSEGRLSRQ